MFFKEYLILREEKRSHIRIMDVKERYDILEKLASRDSLYIFILVFI